MKYVQEINYEASVSQGFTCDIVSVHGEDETFELGELCVDLVNKLKNRDTISDIYFSIKNYEDLVIKIYNGKLYITSDDEHKYAFENNVLTINTNVFDLSKLWYLKIKRCKAYGYNDYHVDIMELGGN